MSSTIKALEQERDEWKADVAGQYTEVTNEGRPAVTIRPTRDQVIAALSDPTRPAADSVMALLDDLPEAEQVAAKAWDAGHAAGMVNATEHRPDHQVTNPHRDDVEDIDPLGGVKRARWIKDNATRFRVLRVVQTFPGFFDAVEVDGEFDREAAESTVAEIVAGGGEA